MTRTAICVFFSLVPRLENCAAVSEINKDAIRRYMGILFEQWLILQVIYYNRLHKKGWRISSYRDAFGVEVDLVIETRTQCIALAIKSSIKARARMFKGLGRFVRIAKRNVTAYVIYQGEFAQRFERLGLALPYEQFLGEVLVQLD